MAKKLTRAALYNMGARVVRVGFCGADYLLHGVDAFATNSGYLGWNWSAYDIGGGVIICTGYRNLVGEDGNKLADKYNEKARALFGKYLPWDVQKKALEQLRAEFVRELLGQNAERGAMAAA